MALVLHQSRFDVRELAIHAVDHANEPSVMPIDPSQSDAQTRHLIQDSGKLHPALSGLGALASLAFLWASNA